ncbi:MAG: type II secretion system F family protein [Actinomycetota bacterium]|nr:type II secretion system F family protein [Actinomycetota bacterium]
MSAAEGALLGLALGGGLMTTMLSLTRSRRPALVDRVAPYLLDLPSAPRMLTERAASLAPTAVGWAVFGPSLRRLAAAVEQVLGGAASIRRRLQRLGSSTTVEQFRVQQVQWGLLAIGATTGLGLLVSLMSGLAPLPLLVAAGTAFVLGVLGRDQWLSRSVRVREERMLAEFPTVTDLLALAVHAGEGPVAAIERIARTSHGELAVELRTILGQVRTGSPVSRALDGLAARTGVPVIARFAEGVAVALERGTPLVDVLHAQAADVREAQRRQLIETGARKEVAMMIPVVFLILPVTVVFAFFPGAIGLDLRGP